MRFDVQQEDAATRVRRLGLDGPQEISQQRIECGQLVVGMDVDVVALQDSPQPCAICDERLEVNQAPDTWTEIDYFIHWYHNYLEVDLEEGARTFKVTLTGSNDGDFPVGAGPYADVRFGNGPGIIPAVPLPAPAMLLAGGLLVLAGLRRGRGGQLEKTE